MSPVPTLPDSAGAAPAALPRVLLADDDPVARLLTSRLLKKAGYDVVAVADGERALAALRESFCPVLLTDWEMPGLDGVGLVKAVRADEWPGYVYTILLTGRDSPEHVVAGLQSGADDYLKKPVHEAELLARVKTAVRVGTLERRLRAAEQEARRLSLTDALTGVYNRCYLTTELAREFERARRNQRPLSLVICDIVHFTKINDTHGQQVGDMVLQAFASVLAESVRHEVDWVARYGGEEFVVVLPATDLSGAATLAAKLRRLVENSELRAGEPLLRVTASFGVAAQPGGWPSETAPATLVERADVCLHRSKQEGRNRVTSAEA
ncbi:MAG: diguanylate cyclase [Pseudomonadota bacterium]